MRSSEQLNEIAAALAKAQAEIGTAAECGKNPHLNTRYATLTSVWDACRAALTKHGLSVVQGLEEGEGQQVRCATRLLHASGQWLESTFALPATKPDPQQFGSAATYIRRYALAAMVGVAPAEDDDGHGAAEHERNQHNERAPRPRPAAPPQNPTAMKRVAGAEQERGPVVTGAPESSGDRAAAGDPVDACRRKYWALLEKHAPALKDDAAAPVRYVFNAVLMGRNTPLPPTSGWDAKKWGAFLPELERHCKECAGGEMCDALVAARDLVS